MSGRRWAASQPASHKMRVPASHQQEWGQGGLEPWEPAAGGTPAPCDSPTGPAGQISPRSHLGFLARSPWSTPMVVPRWGFP